MFLFWLIINIDYSFQHNNHREQLIVAKMAAVSDNSSVSEKFKHLSIENKTCPETTENDQTNILSNNSLPLQVVYKLALNFYKEKEGKAVHLSYEDKLQLVAFSQQVSHGPLSEAVSKLPPLGALDVVGRDRRLAWQKLGNLDADQARGGFVELLHRRCPLFNAYIEAHRCEKEEQERLAEEEKKRRLLEEEERKKQEAEERLKQEQLEKEELIKQQIKQALNQQTYEQFRNYAEQQFPGDPEKQGTLIKQLQEQHYIQYMQQLQAVRRGEEIIPKGTNNEVNANEEKTQTTEHSSEDLNNVSPPALSSLSETLVPANMWTRSDIQAFKQAVSQAEGDGVVRVGHGETVTVRVPTHKDGSRIFWEFATDHYDIGFGVYFEFGTPTSSEVSVHVSESDDEDGEDLDDLDDEDGLTTQDLEAGSLPISALAKPLLTEVVPVYRRDCQSEVYAGSHQYPAEGVYLLKFDNSYSLWRSKTLYYRVYYSQ